MEKFRYWRSKERAKFDFYIGVELYQHKMKINGNIFYLLKYLGNNEESDIKPLNSIYEEGELSIDWWHNDIINNALQLVIGQISKSLEHIIDDNYNIEYDEINFSGFFPYNYRKETYSKVIEKIISPDIKDRLKALWE
ncbi:hypothetical protein ACFLU5_11405 [Bacteroidota bacterium]